MNKEDKKRLEDLRGEQIHLQSQCYLMKKGLEANEQMKKGLEANEQKLAQVIAVIAEYETAETPVPEPGEGKPDA